MGATGPQSRAAACRPPTPDEEPPAQRAGSNLSLSYICMSASTPATASLTSFVLGKRPQHRGSGRQMREHRDVGQRWLERRGEAPYAAQGCLTALSHLALERCPARHVLRPI